MVEQSESLTDQVAQTREKNKLMQAQVLQIEIDIRNYKTGLSEQQRVTHKHQLQTNGLKSGLQQQESTNDAIQSDIREVQERIVNAKAQIAKMHRLEKQIEK